MKVPQQHVTNVMANLVTMIVISTQKHVNHIEKSVYSTCTIINPFKSQNKLVVIHLLIIYFLLWLNFQVCQSILSYGDDGSVSSFSKGCKSRSSCDPGSFDTSNKCVVCCDGNLCNIDPVEDWAVWGSCPDSPVILGPDCSKLTLLNYYLIYIMHGCDTCSHH